MADRIFIVRPEDKDRDWRVARNAFHEVCAMAEAGTIVEVHVGEETRTPEQNAKLWPMLTDVSRQVDWYGQKLSKEDWKDVFTASLRQQRVVPGLDGGFVVLGLRTSKMRKREFSDLIELIYAFGSGRDVKWSEPALKGFEQYREVA